MTVDSAFGVIGLKFDDGKLPWDLLPIAPVREVLRVLQFGAVKYGPHNWQHVQDARRRYYAAAMRHLTSWWEGERLDPETSLHHLAHAACCVLFALHFELEGQK